MKTVNNIDTNKLIVRDRDYLMDTKGIIFKVIGDTHPDSHYLGYVKYYPNKKGNRNINGKAYGQNTMVSKSYGILSNSPDYYLYSDLLGTVITGVPRKNISFHYSPRKAMEMIHDNPSLISHLDVGKDLCAIINYIFSKNEQNLYGLTGSFLVGCFNSNSDIDLVCYGKDGLRSAKTLFKNNNLIKPYRGELLPKLYARRAKYLTGNDFAKLMKQENRKLQGIVPLSSAHINCEPLRDDTDMLFKNISSVKEIGEIQLIAKVLNHSEGLFTPSIYKIKVLNTLSSTIDDADTFAEKVEYLLSYLGAYTGAFRKNDIIHINGKLVYSKIGNTDCFGVELSPWNQSEKYSANLLD